MRALPRLHLVTSDEVLADAVFIDRARAVLDAHGADVALHVRGHGHTGRALHDVAAPLARRARDAGAVLLVNDRLDVALTTAAHGVQLGRRSLPVEVARALLGADGLIGYSAHRVREAVEAVEAGADFVVLGPVHATPSHPGRDGAGPGLVAEAVRVVAAPVLGIGGITPERVPELMAAGARGVAVLSGVWAASDPVSAAGRYLEMLATKDEDRDG